MERSESRPSFGPNPSPEAQFRSPEVRAGGGEVFQSPEKHELVEKTQTEVENQPSLSGRPVEQGTIPMDAPTLRQVDWENVTVKSTAVKDVKKLEGWNRETGRYFETQGGITDMKHKSGVIPAKGGGK